MSGEVIYWDACVFLSWLQGDHNTVEGNDGMQECIVGAENGSLTLFTSVVTRVEVLACRQKPNQEQTFLRTLRGGPIVQAEVTVRIADLARKIRDSFDDQVNKLHLSTPDSIHLATAIHYKADTFLTFDKNNRRDYVENGKTLGLIPLSGDDRLEGLVICPPSPGLAQGLIPAPPSST